MSETNWLKLYADPTAGPDGAQDRELVNLGGCDLVIDTDSHGGHGWKIGVPYSIDWLFRIHGPGPYRIDYAIRRGRYKGVCCLVETRPDGATFEGLGPLERVHPRGRKLPLAPNGGQGDEP